MTEPLLLTEPMSDEELRIHSYPRFLLVWNSIIAALLILLYLTHWTPLNNPILDVHTTYWPAILCQIVITSFLIGVPYAICLQTRSTEVSILAASKRTDINEAQIFLKYSWTIYTFFAAIIILLDLIHHTAIQSILCAFFFILGSLYLWHKLCKIVIQRRGNAVDATIVNLVEFTQTMKKSQDANVPSPSTIDRPIQQLVTNIASIGGKADDQSQR